MFYVFDVDGTLTPSRGVIDSAFKTWFLDFAQKHKVCYVTGSDRDKTVEQIGEDLFNIAVYSFNCTGNEVYQNGQLVYSSAWTCPDDAWLWLEDELYKSPYKTRYGKHFEQRTGLLNFSIVGRNAQGVERTEYYEWDLENNERIRLCQRFNATFPTLQAQVGGETGIDIFPKGCDKSQILKTLYGYIEFFGDRMDPNGNDKPLADAIIDNNTGVCYNVKNWQETWHILQTQQKESDSLVNG